MPTSKNRWILLRGLARGKGHWGSFPEDMQKFFPEAQIEMLDLPGNGERHQEQSLLSMSEYVQDLRSRSHLVKDGKSFQILAISLGGMVAIQWMREFPNEVSKLHLICTSTASTSPFYHRYQKENYLPTLRLFLDPTIEKMERTILEMTTNNLQRRQQFFMEFVEYSKKYPELRGNVLRQLIAASRFRIPQKPPGEINLLGSYGDRLVSPKCTLRLGKRWGIEPKMHDAAGHDIPIDDPQWVLEHLL
jgi:pimeloyl-ACP methyl ester carboxylesterase